MIRNPRCTSPAVPERAAEAHCDSPCFRSLVRTGRPVGCRGAGGTVLGGGSGPAGLGRSPGRSPRGALTDPPPLPARPRGPPARHVTLFTPAAARRTRARPHSFELRNTGPGGPPRAPAAVPPAPTGTPNTPRPARPLLPHRARRPRSDRPGRAAAPRGK